MSKDNPNQVYCPRRTSFRPVSSARAHLTEGAPPELDLIPPHRLFLDFVIAARHGCRAYQARHPLFGVAPSNMAILCLSNQCRVPALARGGSRKSLREPSQAALASLCASLRKSIPPAASRVRTLPSQCRLLPPVASGQPARSNEI